jgi:hypothetical protein
VLCFRPSPPGQELVPRQQPWLLSESGERGLAALAEAFGRPLPQPQNSPLVSLCGGLYGERCGIRSREGGQERTGSPESLHCPACPFGRGQTPGCLPHDTTSPPPST